MNVVVLHQALPADARADEADVLEQAAALGAALTALGHRHRVVTMTGDLDAAAAALRAAGPDVVCNLVESLDGSGRRLDEAPALLERLGLPFTGCGAAATRAAAGKLSSKELLLASGLPTPPAFTTDQLAAGALVPRGRWLLKSVWEHGSLGLEADCVVEADDPVALLRALESRRERLGGEAFAEAYVHGREFNLAMLSAADGRAPEHLPTAEIRFAGAAGAAPRVVGYAAKWRPGSAEDEGTPRAFDVAPADAALVERLQALAAATWRAFGLAGYARVDFRVDDAGAPWIIDVNTNPCLSPDAGFAAAAAAAGLDFAAVVARLLAAATAPHPGDC